MSTTVTRPATSDQRISWAGVRRELSAFSGIVAALLAVTTTIGVGEGVDIVHIDQASPLGQAVMYGQALIPLVAALIARLVTAGTLRGAGFGFRRTSWRTVGRAWGFGLACPLVAAAIVWGAGAAGFRTEALEPQLLLGLSVLVLPYAALALFEDVGWRGLMVTRLATVAGPRTVVLVSGLAWSLFHWPLMIFLGGTPDEVPLAFGLFSFTLGTVALGAVLANMQLRWGIWPGVVAHAAVNAVNYHVLVPLTVPEAHTGWFAGEVGIVSGLVFTVVAVIWWHFAPLVRAGDGTTMAR
jgi:membrane protease YdiL (CAAX protease family)